MMTRKMKMTTIRTYTELSKIKSFDERYRYLKLGGSIGSETFGFDRYVNQAFYRSYEWKKIRDYVILRDHGRDLGVSGREIFERILIHHMNPIKLDDILNRSEYLLNPEYLITTTHNTHNAIHFGDEGLLMTEPVVRSKNDTCPWRK